MTKDVRHIADYGGIRTSLVFDDADGSMTVYNTGDVAGLLDRNKALQNDSALTKSKDMRHVASIPMHTLFALRKQWNAEGIDHKVGMKRFLNDPDMRYFRTNEDKI